MTLKELYEYSSSFESTGGIQGRELVDMCIKHLKGCNGCKYEGNETYSYTCQYCSRQMSDEYTPKNTK